jgi:hypothetical protein
VTEIDHEAGPGLIPGPASAAFERGLEASARSVLEARPWQIGDPSTSGMALQPPARPPKIA